MLSLNNGHVYRGQFTADLLDGHVVSTDAAGERTFIVFERGAPFWGSLVPFNAANTTHAEALRKANRAKARCCNSANHATPSRASADGVRDALAHSS